MAHSVERPPSGWSSTDSPESDDSEEIWVGEVEPDNDNDMEERDPDFDLPNLDRAASDEFMPKTAEQPSPLETYRSMRERREDSDTPEVLDERAEALERMISEGEDYPPELLEELSDPDFFTYGHGTQEAGFAKRLIPERYFSDAKARQEVERITRAIQEERPLKELLDEAYDAAKKGDRKKLVALKLVGARLLQAHAPAVGTREAWQQLPERERRIIRLGEMLTTYAEMSIAGIQRREQKLAPDQAQAASTRFAQYAENDDIPELFKDPLQRAGRALAKEPRTAPAVLTEIPDADAETSGNNEGSVDTDVEATRDTEVETTAAAELPTEPAIPISETELREATPAKTPEDFAAQEQAAVDAMLPPRLDQPPSVEAVSTEPEYVAADTVSEGEQLARGDAALVSASEQPPRWLDERAELLRRRSAQYATSPDPITERAFNLLNENEPNGSGENLDQYEEPLSRLIRHERVTNPAREARRQKYLEIWLNELGFSRTLQQGGKLNKLTSEPLERYYAQSNVASARGRFLPNNSESMKHVMSARQDVVHSMRRAAARNARDPLAASLLTQLADRFELMNIAEARRWQQRRR